MTKLAEQGSPSARRKWQAIARGLDLRGRSSARSGCTDDVQGRLLGLAKSGKAAPLELSVNSYDLANGEWLASCGLVEAAVSDGGDAGNGTQ